MKSLYQIGLTTVLATTPLLTTHAKEPSNKQVSGAIDNLFNVVLPNTYKVCLFLPTEKWRTPTSPIYLNGACYGECAAESETLDQFIITCNPQKTQTISIGKPGLQYDRINPNAVHVTVWDKCFPNSEILYDASDDMVMLRDDFDRLIDVDSLVEIRKKVDEGTLPEYLQVKVPQKSMLLETRGHLRYAFADIGLYGLESEEIITEEGTPKTASSQNQRDYLNVIQTATRALQQEAARCANFAPKADHTPKANHTQDTRIYTVQGDNPYMSYYKLNDHNKINPKGEWQVDLTKSQGYEICIDNGNGIRLIGRSEAFFANVGEHMCLSPEKLVQTIADRKKIMGAKLDLNPESLRFGNSCTFNFGPGDTVQLRR